MTVSCMSNDIFHHSETAGFLSNIYIRPWGLLQYQSK